MSESCTIEPIAEIADREASKARLRLWLKLLKVTKYIEGELRENFRTEFGTTLPRFDVMAALYRVKAGLKMSDLSSALRVSNGNVTGIVDRLVDDKLIERVPVDHDRRATVVRLTSTGREQFARLAAQHEIWIDDMLNGIDPSLILGLMSELDHVVPKRPKMES